MADSPSPGSALDSSGPAGAPASTTMSTLPPPALAPPRFAFLDGLRAFGALGVATYHIQRYGPLHEAAEPILGPSEGGHWALLEPLGIAFRHGWMGVQAFFVISGFVIAHSLRHVRMSPTAAATFVARRYLRLSPPYWVTIVVVTALTVVAVRWLDDPSLGPIPSAWTYLWHLLYFQNIAGHENISTGFWMLCIEMQFYVMYAVLLWLAQRLTGDAATIPGRWPMILCFWLPGLALLFFYQPNPDVAGWIESILGAAPEGASDDAVVIPWRVPDVWAPYFFGVIAFGIVTYAVLEGWMPRWTYWSYAAVMAARIVLERVVHDSSNKALTMSLLAGLAVYACGRMRAMDRWLNVRWLQHIGRISYSLFLIHFAVSWVIKTVGYRLTGTSPWAAVGWMALSLGVSLVAAHYLCLAIEEPAARLSRNFGRGKR